MILVKDYPFYKYPLVGVYHKIATRKSRNGHLTPHLAIKVMVSFESWSASYFKSPQKSALPSTSDGILFLYLKWHLVSSSPRVSDAFLSFHFVSQ